MLGAAAAANTPLSYELPHAHTDSLASAGEHHPVNMTASAPSPVPSRPPRWEIKRSKDPSLKDRSRPR
jgi:hypothetical protein